MALVRMARMWFSVRLPQGLWLAGCMGLWFPVVAQ